MRNQKGYSFTELLVVIVIISIIVAAIAPGILAEIDKSRGSTVIAETRMVYIISQGIVTEETAKKTSTEDIVAGLTGVIDNSAFPEQTRISKTISSLLLPDYLLSKEPTETSAKITHEIADGKVIKFTFEKILSNKHYTAVISNGETVISFEKVRKNE